MALKILLVVSSMGPGGAERVAATLANAWSDNGHEVVLMLTFSGNGECFYALAPSVRLVFLADIVKGASFFKRLFRLFALRRFIRNEDPDVIVSFLSNVNVATIVASMGFGIPVVVCERIDPFSVPTPISLKFACRITYPFADAVMVQTEAVKKKYITAGWPLKHISVIANPLSEAILSIQRNNNRSQSKLLLSVGRFDEQKQFDVLIKIFSNLAHNHPDWKLRIHGEGDLRNNMQRQIDRLGLQSRIELPGLSRNIGQELAKADIFALTSSYEGFPNALLEAMAAGLPCVTFDCPSGPKEISRDGAFAFLVPLGNEMMYQKKLAQLMSDESLRVQKGMQARESVAFRYSLASILAEWDALFRAVGVCV